MERMTKRINGVVTFYPPDCQYDTGLTAGEMGASDMRMALARLAAYEDTGLEPEEYKAYKSAIERQGAFGRLFLDYVGCPRGAVGRMGSVGNCAIPGFELLAAEVLHQPSITDVDGGRWIPVNADALIELVSEYKAIRALGPVEELSALAKARNEGRILPKGSGWFITCKGKKLTVIMDINAAQEAEAAIGGGGDG